MKWMSSGVLLKKNKKKLAEKIFLGLLSRAMHTGYLDFKRETDFFVAFSVGKWIQAVCDDLYELIASKTQQPSYKRKITFCTDGNDQNENGIKKHFNKDCVNFGQVIKDKEKTKGYWYA